MDKGKATREVNKSEWYKLYLKNYKELLDSSIQMGIDTGSGVMEGEKSSKKPIASAQRRDGKGLKEISGSEMQSTAFTQEKG